MAKDSISLKEFLALPVEALPRARFADEGASFSHDAWAVLRESARTGESIRMLCGTDVLVSSTRHAGEWLRAVEAES